ncbi:HK97-gp10 family putative phage morphogenesis protein [Paratissierella segnis]|uniref:HK97 gp10 family phage protein n=1 Tax=Paratissierella segnis TaxID=2763679 RepID=A0A926ERY5_9FIRM|nr:hypothetical protein [Paratissierella segnis]MBC8587108.1 HK97 gp10 family phage protein [Paratissierella segnis]
MGIKLEGFVEFTNKLNKSISQVSDVVEDALLDCGNDLQQKSVDITPKDTGTLRGSAFTEAENTSKPSVIVGFDEEYAIFVHENLEAHHPVGQAKFLEQPLNENKDKYVKHIGDKVNDLLNKN